MMKKYIGFICMLALLACGGSDTPTANEGTSSIVADGTVDESTNTGTPDANPAEVTNNPSEAGVTSIEYVETNHDFGNVMYPSENLYTFKFRNTGSSPLIIESATASCGCTVPNKPEDPIMPGEMGELDVIFRPKEGQQGTLVTKRVTVTANTDPAQSYLEIKGNVLAAMN